jgi:hypothetical protein
LNSYFGDSKKPEDYSGSKLPLVILPKCTHSIHLDCIANFSDFVHTFDCPDCEDKKNDHNRLMHLLDPFKGLEPRKSLGAELDYFEKKANLKHQSYLGLEQEQNTVGLFNGWKRCEDRIAEEELRGLSVVMGSEWLDANLDELQA